MKILRIYLFIPPCAGGMEKHIQRLTDEQRLLGHHVDLIYNQGKSHNPSDIQVGKFLDLKKITFQPLRDIIFFLLVLPRIPFGKKYDLVHVHGDWSLFLLFQFIQKFVQASKIVASVHSGLKKNYFWSLVHKFSLKRYKHIFCSGLGEVKYLRSLGLYQALWQPSGVSETHFESHCLQESFDKKYDVVNVSVFRAEKNIDLFLECAREFKNNSFLLVGDGPMKSYYKNMAKKMELRNVAFVGSKSPSEVSVLLRSSKIFLLTSFNEGTPTALMEAMVNGLPIITTPSNDLKELILDDVNGYVTNDFKKSSVMQKLEKLLTDNKLQYEISVNNKIKSKNFGWKDVATRITHICKGEINEH